ncbi:MAG: hypothetical protein AB3N14_09200 [Flavobacteriaceae bacterium]
MTCINMRYLHLVVLLIFTLGCSTDGEEGITLRQAIGNKEIVLDNIISCAASNENDNLISVFLYPRNNVSNISYFETANAEVDKNDLNNYVEVTAPLLDVFNGYLLKFELEISEEKWVIVSFEEDGKIHLSNPIRLKQISKPTEYLPQNIGIDRTEVAMPVFNWQDGSYDDTKIYFQVVANEENTLLSGTYTFERTFQYYELDNVVLNITEGVPPMLLQDNGYSFSLLGVSEDNWVNMFSVIEFDLTP